MKLQMYIPAAGPVVLDAGGSLGKLWVGMCRMWLIDGRPNRPRVVQGLGTLFVAALSLTVLPSAPGAELLDLGGQRVELVDGEVSDEVAEHVLEYSENLYGRGAYGDGRNILTKLIRYYRGPWLSEAYFLRGKMHYMAGERFHIDSPGDSGHAYGDFLQVYDNHRQSTVVTTGELASTVRRATLRLMEALKESGNRSVRVHLPRLVHFAALYRYITGTTISEVDEYLELDYSREAAPLNFESSDKYMWELNSRDGQREYLWTEVINDKRECEYLRYQDDPTDIHDFRLYVHSLWPSPERLSDLLAGGLFSRMITPTLEPELELVGAESVDLYVRMHVTNANNVDFGIQWCYQLAPDAIGVSESIWTVNGKRIEGYDTLFGSVEADSDNAMSIRFGDYDIAIAFRRDFSIGWKLDGDMLELHRDFHMGGATVTFPALKSLLLERYGSVYDWVGLTIRQDNL